ncbi:MAG: metallophosphoesterase [Roseovarius sp.]
MKFIHLSDIHLTLPGERMGGLDPHRRLAQALADIAAHHADAARLVITGDLTHWGERGAYEALRAALADVPIPVRLLIGNHDDRATFLEVFNDHPRDANGHVNHAEEVEGTSFLYLDTCAPRTHAGHFGPERCAWLEEELARATRARLFLHHNPMPLGVPAEDKIALVPEDRARLADVLDRHRDRIDYLHFGHIHAPAHGLWRGIPFAAAPSTGNQSLPDLQEPDLLQGAPMPPAYNVVLVEGADTVIHRIPFTWDGPVFTAGTEWEDWVKPVAAE